MSHFLDRLKYFYPQPRAVRRRPRRDPRRGPHLGGRLSQPLGARQDRALDAWRELHRLVLAGRSTSRAASSPGRRSRPTTRAPAGTCPTTSRAAARAARATAGICTAPTGSSTRWCAAGCCKSWREARLRSDPVDAWASIVEDRREAARLPGDPRPRRLRALELGRGQRDRRRGQHLHDQEARPRPRHRLFADSGDVDGQLCGGRALPEPDRRRVHELLRLVLRPAADAARRSGASRPTCPNRPTGSTRATSSPGAPTCRRRARPTRISSPRCATRAPRRWR